MSKSIFIPGKITSYVFCIILLAVLIQGMILSPFKSFGTITSGEMTFKLGYPWAFFELNSANPDANPFIWQAVLKDLAIYFFVAYFLEIIIKLILMPFSKNKEPEEQKENISKESLEIMKQGKIAYDYYLLQGVSEQNLIDMFKNKGWTEEGIAKLKEMK